MLIRLLLWLYMVLWGLHLLEMGTIPGVTA